MQIARTLAQPVSNVTDLLVELAATAPSADNSQPWFFSILEDNLVCRFRDRASNYDPFGPMGHGSLMAAGAIAENFTAILRKSGQVPQITLNSSGWSISVDPLTSPIPSSEIQTLLLARHTNRYRFAELPHPPELPSHKFSSRWQFVNNAIEIEALTKALLACSAARFNNQELHEWLFSSLRWTPAEVASGTGLDIETLHLPPGGRQFMKWIAPWKRMQTLNRFGAYRILALADVALFRQAPGIIAFIGGRTPEEIIECGQLMQRTWLSLTLQGIAVHPYYALTDLSNRWRQGKLNKYWSGKVAGAHDIARDVLQLQADEQVHMLFRIGTPTCAPVRSRRLPRSSLIEQAKTS